MVVFGFGRPKTTGKLTETMWRTAATTVFLMMSFGLDQDISNGNVSGVEGMSYMFHVAHALNQSLLGGNVSNAHAMQYMFANVTRSPLFMAVMGCLQKY